MRKTKATSNSSNGLAKARQYGHSIEAASTNIDILIEAIFEKVGQVGSIDERTMQVIESISCFADCALKQLDEIKSCQQKMMGLIAVEMEGAQNG